jgi:hypothetical protein
MIYFLFTVNTVEFLAVHPLMLKTLFSHQRDSLITTLDTIKTVFCVVPASHNYLPVFTVRPDDERRLKDAAGEIESIGANTEMG